VDGYAAERLPEPDVFLVTNPLGRLVGPFSEWRVVRPERESGAYELLFGTYSVGRLHSPGSTVRTRLSITSR
jgi:hypothetical protein